MRCKEKKKLNKHHGSFFEQPSLDEGRCIDYYYGIDACESGGIGRRTGFRIQRTSCMGVRLPPFAPLFIDYIGFNLSITRQE